MNNNILNNFINNYNYYFNYNNDNNNTVDKSLRWLFILIGVSVVLYRFTLPFFDKNNPLKTYYDIRVGIFLWATFSTLLHSPLTPTVDHFDNRSTQLFITSFLLILVLTQSILSLFTILHHIFGVIKKNI